MTTSNQQEIYRAKVNLETAQIRQWMVAGKLGKVTDEQAAVWFETDALVWAVVVSPWVLVQPSGSLQ